MNTCGLIVGLAAVGCLGCGPTAPSCDPRAVTGPTALTLSCLPSGADLQCQAIASAMDQLYVCGSIPNQDVTTAATWTSSDITVATFTAAGFLKVLAPGQTHITATWHSLSEDPIAFEVAPGVTAERLTSLVVIAQSASDMNARIAGVAIDVVPDRGAAQSCVTNSLGSCGALWVPSTTIVVRGSKSGYETAQTTVAPSPSFYASALLQMRAAPSP
jgi:hypothetical protein